MVSITNVSMPGSTRLDGLTNPVSTKDGLPSLAVPPETNQTLSSTKVEYRANSSESLHYKGYKVFKRALYSNETLKLFHPKFNTPQANSPVAPPKPESAAYMGSKQSPVQTANNILGFIEKRLTDRQAAGASEADLNSLLQQARSGIDQGFDQAREDLEKLGLMTPELSGEIDQSYELALNGLEQLSAKFGLADPVPKPESPADSVSPAVDSPVPTSNVAVTDSNKPLDVMPNRTLESSRFSYQSEMRGSLMITTQDGDKIYLDETLINALRYQSVSKTDGTNSRYSAASQYTQELTVLGALDEEEMAAIQDLVEKASDIASLMQTDDFQAALDRALELDFDESEIASFALQLTRVEVFTSKSVVYKRPSPMPDFAPAFAQLDKKIADVVSLLDQLKVGNKDFSEFIAQQISGKQLDPESPIERRVQAFQTITQELLNLHRGVDRDSFQSL